MESAMFYFRDATDLKVKYNKLYFAMVVRCVENTLRPVHCDW